MAVGKNKGLSKGKKNLKKKIADPFSRKEWYDVKVPAIFSKSIIGKTLCNRTSGNVLAFDGLKNRVFDVSLGDLNDNAEDVAYRKIQFRVEALQGRTVLTNFAGMRVTTDKVRSLVKKWQSTIEASLEVKTTDGYLVRIFVIGFTKRFKETKKTTCYAQAAQVRALRKKMFEVILAEATTGDIRDLFKKLIAETIGKEIEKSSLGIYPLTNVFVRKVKIVKSPKVDQGKLLELHEATSTSTSANKDGKVTRAWKEPAILTTV